MCYSLRFETVRKDKSKIQHTKSVIHIDQIQRSKSGKRLFCKIKPCYLYNNGDYHAISANLHICKTCKYVFDDKYGGKFFLIF